MNKLTLLIVSILIYSNSFSGGPWGPGKGKSYLQFGGGIIPSTNQLFYKGNETLFLNRKIKDNSLGLYYEYGISDKLTVIGNIPFNFVGTESTIDTLAILPVLEDGSLSGFGNISVSGKYLFIDKTIKVSAGLKLSLPTASQNGSLGLRTGYNSFDIMPTIALGYSKDKLYTYAEFGYNVYRSNLSNNFMMDAEIGYKVYKKATLALHFGMVLSTFKHSNTNPIEHTGLYADGQEFAAMTLKFSTPVYKNIGINLNTTIANFFGNYVQRSPAIGGSVYLKF